MITRFAAVAFAIAVLTAPFFSLSGAAEEAPKAGITVGDLRIENPWARATPGGSKIGGGYLVIHNDGAKPDRLIGGATEIAGKLEIHAMAMENNVMRMRHLENGIEIPAGGSLELKPGGYHLMFVQLKGPIAVGAPFAATLEFERAGKVDLTFAVAPIGAKSFDHSAGHMQGMRKGTARGSHATN